MDELKYCGPPIHILLAGGIGSGKSVVGQRFSQLGATVIEADRLGHALLEVEGEAFRTVSERWPSVVVGGHIDRGALAEIVFTDQEQLSELEALMHPAIIHRISEIAAGADNLVVEIPLILDVPGDWRCVFVDASEDVRLRRRVDSGSSEADVRQRMANQPTRDEWVSWCDVVIENNGSMEDLKSGIDTLWYGLRTTDDGLRP